MRILGVALVALMITSSSSAMAGEGGVEENYSREWIGKSYGADGLPEVSAAFDALPGSHSIYGQLRIAGSFAHFEDGMDDQGSLSQDNQASILGVRGWIGNDEIKAIYNAQFGLNYDNSTVLGRRFAWVGLKHHKAGQVIVGTTSTPYKMPGVRIDPFYNTAAGRVNAVGNYGLSRFNNGFINNTLEYKTPSFGGFTVNGAVFIDDSTQDDHGANAGVAYKNGAFTGGAQYLHASAGSGLNPSKDVDMLRAHGKWTGEGWSLGGSYEHEIDKGRRDVDYVYVAGTFDPCENWTLAGSFGFESDGAAEGFGGSVGAFYELLKGVYLYGLISHVQIDDETVAAPSRTVGSVGINLAFSVGDK